MRLHAIIKDNIVTKIESLDSEAIRDQYPNCLCVDIHDDVIKPSVGFILSGNKMIAPQAISYLDSQMQKMSGRFVFGNNLADYMVKRMSVRNLELIALGQTLNIGAVISQFNSIESLLRKCALPTVIGLLNSLIASYPEYTNEFQYALTELQNYINYENSIYQI